MSKCSDPKTKPRRLVGVFLAASILIFSLGLPVLADDSSGKLAKLEDKYFQHDFSKDETADRIERLEKLIFGEARTGSTDERLKNLLGLVPDLDKQEQTASPSQGSAPASADTTYSTPQPKQLKPATPITDASEEVRNTSSYPAVTAMEKKLFGRDYVGESVGKRLDRLEIRAFGKTSASEDLQDRVDKLKSSTGVDVAKVKPQNSEWADEDEDPTLTDGVQPFTGIGGAGDDPSLQRNYRKQQSAYAPPRPSYDPYAGTGTFGAGVPPLAAAGYNSGTFGSGNLGSSSGGSGRFDGMPPSAPEFNRQGSAPAPAMGVSQQLALLEKEVFNKTYEKDKQETILTRLSRLESTVFPQDKPASGKSLPDRVSRLLAAVPISQNMPATAPQAKRQRDPDFPDLDFPGPGTLSKNPGGLSKIINGLGNALGGSYTGSYAVAPGTLVTDPSTGLLYDQYTGTLIDPMTGAVVGRRAVGGGGYPSYGGFNSGLSPMSPFGSMGGGSGMNFGFGGGGIRIGGWP